MVKLCIKKCRDNVVTTLTLAVQMGLVYLEMNRGGKRRNPEEMLLDTQS